MSSSTMIVSVSWQYSMRVWYDMVLVTFILCDLIVSTATQDWFSGCLKKVVLEVGSGRGGDTNTTDGGGMSTAKKTEAPLMEDFELMEQFSSIQLEFQELAETIIIMLHLEVRCHCFYYLLPAMQKVTNYNASICIDRTRTPLDKLCV